MKKVDHVIGIPTLNRVDELDVTIRSILNNTVLPSKIIIVDQSDNDETYKLIKDYKNESKVIFWYLRLSEKGLTKARNAILASLNEEDIITFLDDDVTLDKSYIENIQYTFKKYKDVVGVQGFTIQSKKDILKRILKLNFKHITEFPKVLECFENTYPLIVKRNKVMKSEWLSGCNMSYRISDIKSERFEEKFILYGLGEDLEFSYRLYLKGNRLLLNSSALLIHRVSKVARLPSKAKLLMRFGYRRFMISQYREKEKVNFLFNQYIENYKSRLKILKIRAPEKFKNIEKSINEILKIVDYYTDEIDSGNLQRLNEAIIEELKK